MPTRKESARLLRAQGKSIADIAKEVGASKSGVAKWVRDIRLSKAQKTALRSKSRLARQARWAAFHRQAEEQWPSLSRDPLFMFGLALYIGEGTKTEPNRCKFSNCDPRVHHKFLDFLRSLGVAVDSLKFVIQTHGNLEGSIRFWSEELQIPRAQIQGSVRVSRSSKRTKAGKQPYGTLHVKYDNTAFRQKLERWIQLALG